MGDEWTEPDTSEERWSQPWEEEWIHGWPKEDTGPEWGMAYEVEFWHVFADGPDFYAPRARFVSDR